MFIVSKRNGEKVDFNIQKIKDAIDKAFIACKRETHPSIIDDLAQRVAAAFGSKIKNGVITVEEIQDSVEEVLIKYDYGDVAKAYILYRKKHEDIRKTKETLINYKNVVDNYLNVNDWRVKENSTVTYSVGGLILSNSGAVTANYWLTEVYDEEIANAHRNAEIHIHDLSMLTGYCAGWSLKQLIKEGLGGIPGKITSSPAKHLSTLCNQMVNFLGIMQNEWAGAQAFSSFDTYLAPFVKIDNLSYNEVKQCIQSFIYGVNTPSRWGTQSPFTNVTLDWTVPNDLAELPAVVGGKEQNFKYKDCKKEMDMVNRAFIEVMIEGDANGRGFQYPIPTYSITKDFDWSETENNKLLFEMAAKYGTPYFSNYVNSDMEPSDVRSMCCRLRLDLRELRKKSGGFFGSGESTGSVGVVTINMPRLAYLAETAEEFYQRLDRLMDISARSLKIKRNTIERFMENGLYPYTKRYLGTFNNHFSTIGLVGMNEACLNAKWLRKDLRDDEAVKFTVDVLNHMRERLKDYQEKYGDLYNLEATPAESTAYRFAKHDKEKFPNIITANMQGDPYYTNSSHLPVGTTDDIFNALDVQDELQTLYTSGTVFHTFLGEKLPDWKAAANLVRTIANNYKLPYYTLSPTYSVCKNHGYITGEVYTCPHCGEATEVNSRITGYYRPVQNWNDGKAQEFKDRKEYSAKVAATRIEQMGEDLFKSEPVATTSVNKEVNENVTATATATTSMPKELDNQMNAAFNNEPVDMSNVSTENFYKDEEVVIDNHVDNVDSVVDSVDNVESIDRVNSLNSVNDAQTYNIEEKKEDDVRLFVTKTCPNCKKAEELLDMAGIKYSIVDANENPDECEKYQIMQAPTLIVNDKDKYVNLSNVIKYVEDTTLAV
ncbi:MAG: ribonucleoside triphosphate reductase [Lachnospiraceae bacterium]|nr:ribonucleoside triphosphate reductase [Lachnospiraceae bacterium]